MSTHTAQFPQKWQFLSYLLKQQLKPKCAFHNNTFSGGTFLFPTNDGAHLGIAVVAK